MSELSLKEYAFLRSLHGLRYLRSSQIRKLWFRDRTKGATEKRLSQMVGEGLIERTVLGGERATVLRLGPKGLVRLSEVFLGQFERTEPLSAVFLPHLLDTNAVFIVLAGVEWDWARLPFRWRGSHCVHFRFPQLVTGGDGGVCRRRRLLVPDALVTPSVRCEVDAPLEPRSAIAPRSIVTPASAAAPQCFLELDRSTECLSEAPARSSIVRKLLTYKAFILQNVPGRPETAYDVVFKKHQRSPRVIFVVASNDLADRRRSSIIKAAREHAGELDVRCVRLDDAAGVREAFALPPAATSTPVPRVSVPIRPDDLPHLRRLLVLLNAAANEVLTDEERVRWKWLASNVARAVLPGDAVVPGLVPVTHAA